MRELTRHRQSQTVVNLPMSMQDLHLDGHSALAGVLGDLWSTSAIYVVQIQPRKMKCISIRRPTDLESARQPTLLYYTSPTHMPFWLLTRSIIRMQQIQ